MTRQLFDKQLRELHDEVLTLSTMVEEAIERSVRALQTRDIPLSEGVVHADAAINKKRYEIEEKCIHTIALQQPMAADLRVLVAILFIATELERMADHAEGIARINQMLGEEPLPRPLGDIVEMGDRARDMLDRSIKSFIDRDAETARRIGIDQHQGGERPEHHLLGEDRLGDRHHRKSLPVDPAGHEVRDGTASR